MALVVNVAVEKLFGSDLVAADAERIGDSIDVVEPRRDQRDLQNPAVVESDAAQRLMIRRRTLRRIFRQFYDVIEHHAFLLGDRSGAIVVSQRLDQSIIQRHPTQKLCV